MQRQLMKNVQQIRNKKMDTKQMVILLRKRRLRKWKKKRVSLTKQFIAMSTKSVATCTKLLKKFP